MLKRTGKALSINLEEFPQPVFGIIQRRRYEAVQAISIAGLSIALGSGLLGFYWSRSPSEFAVRTVPISMAFLAALLLNQHDRDARRSGLALIVFSAVAMIVVRTFSAAAAAGHFLYFPAAAVGSVLLLGLRTGLLIAGSTLGALYIIYFVNVYFHPFPVFIPVDRTASIIGAFLMTLVMIILSGRLLRDVQREYEASNRLLTAHLDRYRLLLSLLTNELSAAIANLKEAASQDDGESVKKCFNDIHQVISTARRLRSESLNE